MLLKVGGQALQPEVLAMHSPDIGSRESHQGEDGSQFELLFMGDNTGVGSRVKNKLDKV